MPFWPMLLSRWKIGLGAVVLLIVAVLFIKACSAEKKADEQLRTGAVAQERADSAAKVLGNVEKANEAVNRSDPVRDDRLHDKYCRDCSDGQ